jgi:N-acyl-D-aspartate/D-glutamate deacylase
MFDLAVRNGLVVDGSGAEPFRADIGVVGARIAEIGVLSDHARETVDAEGHVVSPGFIDGHTHLDAQIMWDPFGSCSSWHGVTTAVMGNCGFTLAPARADARDLAIRNLERAEDISRSTMAAGIDWTWETFPEYLDAVEAQPLAINVAANIGHSALRSFVMGERAFGESATDDDLESMERFLGEAIDAGAVGFTTSRNSLHLTPDDAPVASRQATWQEVVRLVRVLGRRGAGVFQLAPGPGAPGDAADTLACLDQVLDLSVSSRVPTMFGLGIATPDWRDRALRLERANGAGAEAWGLTHSRGMGLFLSFETHLPFDPLPGWREVRSRPLKEQRALLGDPDVCARLVTATRSAQYGAGVGAEMRPPDYEAMEVVLGPLPPNPTVGTLAAHRGLDPVELMIDLAVKSDLRQLFFQPFRREDPDERLRLLRHPHTVMTFSDAGAHVTTIADSSIQTFLLAYWVRTREAMSLAEAVRMLTSVPAKAWRLADRGLVRTGMAADLNVFDPATVGPELPTVAYDLPAGGQRFVQRSTGMTATIVGGEVVLRDNEPTNARPGRLVRCWRQGSPHQP